LPALAAELVQLKPDVIVADVTVANLGRPGANVTGITIMLAEMSAKRLQLLKEAAPNVSRVAVLWNPALPWHPAMLKEVEVASPSLGLHPVAIAVRSRGDDFGNAFAEIRNARADALFVSETMTPGARRQIVEFATKNRLPVMFMNRDYVAAGGLMSYASNFPEMYRQAAAYVDKILKGAKPGDLPVEQPTKFELVINLKTAKTLGLTIPQSLLVRADEIVQ
jgi:ABC-type uncharacterized transport system substrate-binding protein